MSNSAEIKLLDLIGEDCITLQEGQKLYPVLKHAIESKQGLIVDLARIEVVASPFLNASFGLLLKDYSREQLRCYIAFCNATADQLETLRRVIDNSEQYWKNEQMRTAIDHLSSESAQ
jgi:hypothetical protein